MERKNIDKNVAALFWQLIKATPALIKDRELIYNLEGEEIKIWWKVKTESDTKNPSCSEYNKEVFTRETPSSFFSYWSIDQSKQLDGYTFYITTPVYQFKVPELSRQELVNAQNLIEEHFEKFIPNYLDNLLNIPESLYGEIKIKSDHSAYRV